MASDADERRDADGQMLLGILDRGDQTARLRERGGERDRGDDHAARLGAGLLVQLADDEHGVDAAGRVVIAGGDFAHALEGDVVGERQNAGLGARQVLADVFAADRIAGVGISE